MSLLVDSKLTNIIMQMFNNILRLIMEKEWHLYYWIVVL